MTTQARLPPVFRKPAPRRRVPAFYPVPGRVRRDGWTPLRQAEFIGWLAQTRSVSAAAQAVGMARETAYRLRRRPGAQSFAAAWDAVLGVSQAGRDGAARKVTEPGLHHRLATGTMRPVVQRGKFLGVVKKTDNSALFALLARLDRAAARGRQAAEGHDIISAVKCQATCPTAPDAAIVKIHVAPIRTCRTRQSV